MVREHAPGAAVVEIPHLFAAAGTAAPAGKSVRMRQSLGVPARVSVRRVRLPAGIQAPVRRAARLRIGCGRLRPMRGCWWPGAFVSSDLARAVAPLLRGPGIVRLPYLAERDFWRAALAVDACINLRYPAAGETSGHRHPADGRRQSPSC